MAVGIPEGGTELEHEVLDENYLAFLSNLESGKLDHFPQGTWVFYVDGVIVSHGMDKNTLINAQIGTGKGGYLHQLVVEENVIDMPTFFLDE